MPDEPSDPAVQNTESVAQPLLDRWQPFFRATLRWVRKNFLALIAIAISTISAYFTYQSQSIGQKNLDIQGRNDRPAVAIINAGVEGLDQEKINLSLQFKNVTTRTAYSLVIVVIGFDPKTEKRSELAQFAGTDPMRHNISFTSNAPIKRSEMLPVVVLCLLYADEDKKGFTDHLYYSVPDASKLSGRVELSALVPEQYKRVDDLKICRM
jgi:hypothetical protein